ncbi:MAG: hypothetical protein LBQ08_03975 [Holosporaceae bacterium]|nr:hypothetical protein [Holosporaceae bacterium]
MKRLALILMFLHFDTFCMGQTWQEFIKARKDLCEEKIPIVNEFLKRAADDSNYRALENEKSAICDLATIISKFYSNYIEYILQNEPGFFCDSVFSTTSLILCEKTFALIDSSNQEIFLSTFNNFIVDPSVRKILLTRENYEYGICDASECDFRPSDPFDFANVLEPYGSKYENIRNFVAELRKI